MRLVLSVLLPLVVLSGCRSDPKLHGTLLEPPMEAKDFELVSSEGRVTLDDYAGRFVVLAFGYTHCPDVCPATMSHLAQAMRHLGEDARDVQVAMVAVDPERDTPERTHRYAAGFDDAFVGLSGAPEQIADMAGRYGIYYEKSDSTISDVGYLVDHTAHTLVLDRQGRTRLVWSFGITGEQMASDLRYLIDHG